MTTSRIPRPYTPTSPSLTESSNELRARIPGWGADLDPADRPSVPRERLDPELSGTKGKIPVRQPESRPRERSLEHGMLPPVFGTAQPLRGLSGAIRRLSYSSYSEGRTAHWLLLVVADRVDVLESAGRSILSGRPDNPVTETGIKAELTHHGLGSRFDGKRADIVHHPMDPVIVAGPWLLGGWLAMRAGRTVLRRRSSARGQ